MLRRSLHGPLEESLADSPVVLLTGARQVGKSTLARGLVPEDRYLTLDDATILAAAQADPTALVAQHEDMVVIDEVQRAPGLLLAIKASVDRVRRPGRFLLTGSTNLRFIPDVADALVGRMEILTLWPLSQGRSRGGRSAFSIGCGPTVCEGAARIGPGARLADPPVTRP